MKRLFVFWAMSIFAVSNLSAQNLTSYVEYWDYWKTMVKRKFTVRPDGVQHGTELWYDKTGTLTNTTVYNNGEWQYFTTHYKDKSVHTQGEVIQLPDADDQYSFNGKPKTLDLCKSYKAYRVDRSVFIESKMYQQAQPDSLGNDYPFSIITTDNGCDDAKLLNWRLESYSIKGAHWGSLTFTTSSDKKTETIKSYSKDGALTLDATYDIYKQFVTIRTLANNSAFKITDGYLSIETSICTSDEGKIYELQFDKTYIGTIKMPMSRKEFYNKIIFAMMDDDTEQRFMAVSPSAFWQDLSYVMKFIDQSKVQKKFLGRAFDMSYFGFQGDNALGLMNLVEGDVNNGKYEFRSDHLDIDATLADNKFTSFKLTAYHCTYEGGATMLQGENKDIKHPVTQKYVDDLWTPMLVPHGKGLLKECEEAYKTTDYKTAKKIVVYDGQFVNGAYEGFGKFYFKDYDTIKEYEGDFKKGEYNGKGVLKINIPGNNSLYEGGFKSGKYDGNGSLKKSNTIQSGQFAEGSLVKGSTTIRRASGYKKVSSTNPNSIEVILVNGSSYIGEPTKEIATLYGKDLGLDICDNYSIQRDFLNKETIKGEFTTANGNKYKGEFGLKFPKKENPNEYKTYTTFESMEKRLVKGTIDVATSEGRFVGEVANGKINGKGKVSLKNGNTYEGKFIDGVLDVYTPAKVSVKMPTGDRYEGEILNGKLHGKGHVKCVNGDFYKGVFQAGKFSGTGDVRVTTKKGVVYNGAVVGNVCQKVGAVKKIPAYKGVLPAESIKVGTILN